MANTPRGEVKALLDALYACSTWRRRLREVATLGEAKRILLRATDRELIFAAEIIRSETRLRPPRFALPPCPLGSQWFACTHWTPADARQYLRALPVAMVRTWLHQPHDAP